MYRGGKSATLAEILLINTLCSWRRLGGHRDGFGSFEFLMLSRGTFPLAL